MRITKRIREEAALICAVAASNSAGMFGPSTKSIAELLDIDGDAELIASIARARCAKPWWIRSSNESDAEAEALIRTGWTP